MGRLIDWKRLFAFRGRINRLTYWTVLAALVLLDWAQHGLGVATVRSAPELIPYMTVAIVLLTALTAWALVCLSCQRLHDIGLSGWWQVVPLALGAGAFALAEPRWAGQLSLNNVSAGMAYAGGYLVEVGMIVALGLWPGTAGSTRFDPPVRGAA